MKKHLIVAALDLKLTKLLEKYADQYFEKMTGNGIDAMHGYVAGTDDTMRKIDGEVNLIVEEIDRLNSEIVEELMAQEAVDFEKIKVQVEQLSVGIEKDESIEVEEMPNE
jgi:hypothetical protein